MTHWISYSEPSGSRIAKTLQAQGEDAFAYPVTRIQRLPLPGPMPETCPDFIIALSQHAVAAYLTDYAQPSHQGAQVLAIGPSTAQGLLDAGGFRVEIPDEANSEGLLALPALQQLQKHQSVWLLTGEGGRDLVAQVLKNQCQLSRYDLYRRESSMPTALSGRDLQSIWVGSIHALQQISAGAQELGIGPGTVLVVPSQRVADHAKGLGWYKLVVCKANEPGQIRRACERIADD